MRVKERIEQRGIPIYMRIQIYIKNEKRKKKKKSKRDNES